MQLRYLDPQMLESDPESIRDDPGDVDGLAATIAEQGLLQPPGVIELGEGRYRVIYGNRRREAALKLGMTAIPCIVLGQDEDDPDLLVRQLIENVQRLDLNDIEKARAFARMRARLVDAGSEGTESELDDKVGTIVGLTGRTVRRYLGLLELPDEVQQMLRRGDLNVTQAQHLRRIPNTRTQIELARAAVEEGMSAADLSRLAGYFIANPNLTLETALIALEQGGQARTPMGPDISITGAGLPNIGGQGMTGAKRDDDFLDDSGSDLDDLESDLGEYLRVEEEVVEETKTRTRVFRIRSLDQMLDETDRLSRAYAEGDLHRWVKEDSGAPVKVRLVLRQLEKLSHGLREIAQQHGWHEEDEG